MQIGRGAQVRRALAVVGTAIVTASLAHTIGGGAPPGVVTIALALALSAPFAMVVVGGRQSSSRAAFSAVGAQLALHALYSLTPRAGTSTLAPAHAAGSHDHGTGTGGALVFSTGAPVHDEHFGPAMLVAHSIAALLTVFAVALADRMHDAVRFAARGVDVARIVLTAPLVPPLTAHVVPAVPRVVGTDASSLRCTALRYRGPPRQLHAALAATR